VGKKYQEMAWPSYWENILQKNIYRAGKGFLGKNPFKKRRKKKKKRSSKGVEVKGCAWQRDVWGE